MSSRVDLSYCVVNTDGREHLIACLEAIRDTHPGGLEHELLVLDNASGDESAEAVRHWSAREGLEETVRLIERDRRAGKAENDSILLREARGELCLLLNEDSELRPGAAQALVDALRSDPQAGAAGALLLDSEGDPVPCAWRLPSIRTALASALFMHRAFVTQSGGEETREVGWVQSAAMLVRRAAAAEVSYLDPQFFVYSDETDFCRRLDDAGWRILHVPAAKAVHHEQLATDRRAGARRVTEFHRGRDLYMRKHFGPVRAALFRALSAWAYLPRALAAIFLPGRSPGWYWLHARRARRPWSAEGLREAAEAYNRRLRP
ncbi:MAG TPA: glycosyltransferase family 2 protein [Solirubrobacterales bacterium]|nr:glycosyltransferase family 2 protein [Solirubrobacterales bacterium]